jgi:hypothetical protein
MKGESSNDFIVAIRKKRPTLRRMDRGKTEVEFMSWISISYMQRFLTTTMWA